MIFMVYCSHGPLIYDSSIVKGDNNEENASKCFLQSWHSFCGQHGQVLREVHWLEEELKGGWQKTNKFNVPISLSSTSSFPSIPFSYCSHLRLLHTTPSHHPHPPTFHHSFIPPTHMRLFPYWQLHTQRQSLFWKIQQNGHCNEELCHTRKINLKKKQILYKFFFVSAQYTENGAVSRNITHMLSESDPETTRCTRS